VSPGAFAGGAQLVGSVTLSLSQRTKTRHKAELAAMFVRQGWRGVGLGTVSSRPRWTTCASTGRASPRSPSP